MNPSTQLKTGKLSISCVEVSRFESQPCERVLFSLHHPRVSLANNPKQKQSSPSEDAVCRTHMWKLGDWIVLGMARKTLVDTGLNLAQATRNCCVVAFEGKCWWFQGNFRYRWDVATICNAVTDASIETSLHGALGLHQGTFFHPLCADTAEAECLGMHLPLASVSGGQCSDRNRNSDWAKLIHTLVKAAGCQVSYSGFCKITVPGPWYIRNTICFSWNLPKLVILLHIPKLYNSSSISSLPLV